MTPSWYDTILFRQAVPIVRIGRKRPLQAEDALPLPENLDPRNAEEAFETMDTSNFRRFTWQVFGATGRHAWNMLALILARVLLSLATPIILKLILEALPEAGLSTAIPVGLLILGVALGTLGMTGAIVVQHFYYQALQAFQIIVNGVNRRVVRHALRLRHSSRSQMNTGDMVNHLSSDTDAVAETSFYLPEAITGVAVTIAVVVMLSVYLGWGALFSVVTLIVLSPVALYVAKRYRTLDHKVMEHRDERVTLMAQILQGIRVVKFQAWEPSVHAEVAEVRKHEIATRIKIVVTDSISTAMFFTSTTVVAFVGFGSYVLLGGELTAPLVFACIALFTMLEDPFGMISHLLANMQHANVATSRLDKFFSAKVRDEDKRPVSTKGQAVGLEVQSATMTYPGAKRDALCEVTLSIAPGSAVAVVGSVGSGKSTLLRSLAGLHHLSSGTVSNLGIPNTLRPRASYVPQEAFIMNASVEENILFGADSDKGAQESFSSVLHDCALEQDLVAMPGGMQTEIGERGVNLSGGQKQRVSLARAAMNAPGIVFLDDPLSAVDADTENLLVERLLFRRWKNITRVVVTHRLAHLKRFDHIIVIDDGRIVAQGSYEDVRDHIPAGAELLDKPIAAEQIFQESSTPHVTIHEADRPEVRITDDEDRDSGAVGLRIYLDYLRAMVGAHPMLAPLIFVGLISTSALITVLPIIQTSWLGYWTDQASGAVSTSADEIGGFWASVVSYLGLDVSDPLFAIAIFGLLGTFVLTGWVGERLLWLYRSAAAGRKIHDDALGGVLAAPLRFFDSTPMGRVLNRFARDQEGVDDHLSWNWEQSFKSLSQTIGALALVVMVLPVILFVLIPVLIVYYKLQKDYRSAAREAKRLESIARSPRYAHFKELVTGLDVIHGYGREAFFMNSFYDILAAAQRQFWTSIILNRWFSVRVPLISGLVSIGTSIGIVFLAREGAITAGVAGVVLTYALSFWWNLSWSVRAFSEVESRMTSVERLKSYGSLAPEPNHTTPDSLPDSTPWPVNGEVVINNLAVRYAPHLPMILKEVSFTVPARSKVGIIGRTGSGKSTLFQTLFRFVEPETGLITIDGVDITSIPLQRLRRNIAIIPQDPTLFIGSVRSNLDRFSECSDAEVWTALRRVRLDELVQSLDRGLDASVNEGGLNFSQGQRQLLCMARAILLESRVIVLDEATASVDLETDALIQTTIREEFADVTVMIIAHRLDTVADADMVVELSEGRVINITKRSLPSQV